MRKEIDGENHNYVVDTTSLFNNILTANEEAFIYGNGRVGVSGNTYFHDEMSSPIRAMNSKGESISRYASDVFGNTRLSEKSSLITVVRVGKETHKVNATENDSSYAALPLPSMIRKRLEVWRKEQAEHKRL